MKPSDAKAMRDRLAGQPEAQNALMRGARQARARSLKADMSRKIGDGRYRAAITALGQQPDEVVRRKAQTLDIVRGIVCGVFSDKNAPPAFDALRRFIPLAGSKLGAPGLFQPAQLQAFGAYAAHKEWFGATAQLRAALRDDGLVAALNRGIAAQASQKSPGLGQGARRRARIEDAATVRAGAIAQLAGHGHEAALAYLGGQPRQAARDALSSGPLLPTLVSTIFTGALPGERACEAFATVVVLAGPALKGVNLSPAHMAKFGTYAAENGRRKDVIEPLQTALGGTAAGKAFSRGVKAAQRQSLPPWAKRFPPVLAGGRSRSSPAP